MPLFCTVPYLILVCDARSVTDLIGVFIFLTVRNAAKLAVYEDIKIKAKNHHALVRIRPGSVDGEASVLPCSNDPNTNQKLSFRSERSYFEFLNPLHPLVWFCTFGAFVVVSLILYMLEKIGASHSKDIPTISFKESFWFVFGSLLQGSTDASPSTLPGRILTSAWWFFALILIRLTTTKAPNVQNHTSGCNGFKNSKYDLSDLGTFIKTLMYLVIKGFVKSTASSL
jgi:hypothetical protein